MPSAEKTGGRRKTPINILIKTTMIKEMIKTKTLTKLVSTKH
jgi:hypothetical protein